MPKREFDRIMDKVLTEENVLADIKTALQDFFIAKVSLEDGYLGLDFFKYKKFKLYLEEVKRNEN